MKREWGKVLLTRERRFPMEVDSLMPEFDRIADIYDVTRKRSDETMGPAIEGVETGFEMLNLVSRRA